MAIKPIIVCTNLEKFPNRNFPILCPANVEEHLNVLLVPEITKIVIKWS